MWFSGLISRSGDDLEFLCLKYTKVYIKKLKILRFRFVSHFLVTMCGILLEALTYSVLISFIFFFINRRVISVSD